MQQKAKRRANTYSKMERGIKKIILIKFLARFFHVPITRPITSASDSCCGVNWYIIEFFSTCLPDFVCRTFLMSRHYEKNSLHGKLLANSKIQYMVGM